MLQRIVAGPARCMCCGFKVLSTQPCICSNMGGMPLVGHHISLLNMCSVMCVLLRKIQLDGPVLIEVTYCPSSEGARGAFF